MLKKLIHNPDRMVLFGFVALFAVTSLIAEAASGIFQVNTSGGQPTIVLDGSDGSVKLKKLRKFAAGTNTIVEASDGTDISGFTETGVPILLRSGYSFGSIAAPTAANDTVRISVTFAAAEGDTVTPNSPPGYDIELDTVGVTIGAGAVGPGYVGDKYADSFEIINPSLLGSGVTFKWRKTRTSDVSP